MLNDNQLTSCFVIDVSTWDAAVLLACARHTTLMLLLVTCIQIYTTIAIVLYYLVRCQGDQSAVLA